MEQFFWPQEECSFPHHQAFAGDEEVPVIDLTEEDSSLLCRIGEACSRSGFFQVINHGVTQELIDGLHTDTRELFQMPDCTKMQAGRVPGDSFGYSGRNSGRFRSKCPWKETFSMRFSPSSNIQSLLYKIYSAQHQPHSDLYERYCKEMDRLGTKLMELLARSLHIRPDALHTYFGSGFSIFRLNMYPPSEYYSRLLGTGPHTDPCALTILHQDQVGGLQVFRNGTWLTVTPRQDAFVISIGDTFQALCNHKYKSAKHRAVIHPNKTRHSITYFINPGLNAVIKPLSEFLNEEEYPKNHVEFTWGQYLEFTQKHYRADVNTLEAFELHIRAK